ncbi:UV radiation resistance protein and autophagy-related subunit 14-domain-containing protein [Epithele typhae]|uniref:UV radiation resistance protein and autophagy-related subunit 14-domain-containing protein n=1 Tax=Epithele typhae TaxID=378194 RepID=UPI002007473C|nr:UV radiation resistance protein and autophagy-related subunit 14-domain-containing protein [Epithele typhae]KAH9930448.1 UV radiation resistance protein and autophagy-related subunit 14-domain-containing protein [Epithele typhae]
MECANCELRQRQFYCENCLRQHLLSFRLQTQHAATDRDARIADAQRSLATAVEPARLRRAELKSLEERVQEVWDGVNGLRSTNDQLRERIHNLRGSLATRRRTLANASSLCNTQSSSASSTSSSASPPHALSSSPQIRRASSSSHSSTPPPSATRPTSISRPLSSNFFTASSPQSARSPLSIGTSPPQNFSRPSFLSGAHTNPYGFAQGRTISGSAPYGTPISTRGIDPVARQIEELQAQMTALSDTIARARSGLVQELVEVFSVVEVGGRPPLGGKAGTKGEWTIGGLVLPVPGDIRRYPPDHINAVLTHTIHFVTLLAFYLGIKLPFEIVWSRSSIPPTTGKGSGLLGVGIPWIGAIRGAENGGWARWSSKQPLHVTSAPPAPAPSPTSSPSPSRPSPTRSATSPASSGAPTSPASPTRPSALSASLADSHLADGPPPSASSPGSAFTSALAMLLYDVCYLAHTQAVDVPLAHAGDALGNLWAVCCSPELGRRAHATRPLLPPPTPPGFPLDFAQLLQATAATPARARARGTSGKGVGREVRTERIVEEDEGWDLLEADLE